jgi:hypothetical protein
MLSLLPKIGDRNFIVAFVVPSLLLAIISNLFFGWSFAAQLLQDVTDKSIIPVVYFVAGIWLFAILLSACNFWMYRILEGYLPPFRWLHWRRHKYLNKVERIRSERDQLFFKLRTPDADQQNRAKDLIRYSQLTRQAASLPPRPQDILPTSFGNGMKCIETYAIEVYGADTVALWPHLLPVVSDAYANALAEARSQIDFFVNCTFVGLVIFGISLAKILNEAILLKHAPLFHFLWLAGSVGLARLSYKAAVASIPQWGSLVNAGFDCYLPALAKQLGFELPKTVELRKHFWRDFSEQAAFRVRPDGSAIFQVEKWVEQSDSNN